MGMNPELDEASPAEERSRTDAPERSWPMRSYIAVG